MTLEEYECPIKEIHSVGQFIEAIENNPRIDDYACFRGEAKDFGKKRLTASGLRSMTTSRNVILCQDFYSEVHSKLTQNEKENFLAFCQHHGLPTNLLDITSNPLIALFFACYGNDYIINDSYVYGFYGYMTNVTESIKKISFKNIFDTSLDYFYRNKNLKKDILYYLKNSHLAYSNINENNELNKHKYSLLNKWIKILESNDDFDYYPDEILKLIDRSVYSPLLSFERATYQHGKFLFQWYTYYEKQNIIPDCIFQIPSIKKIDILKTLDKLNINRASLFQDYDNIAKYIKEKHGYK
ncbi:MAG: FRG domain-containing protein [Ruminococcus sp.]|jgi:hypothetical protein|nr:FRG domain-containing protein [Ruminococcus sp.]